MNSWHELMRNGAAGGQGFVDMVGQLDRVADELVELEPAAMTDGELATDLVRLRRAMDRLESVYTAWAKAAEPRGIGTEDGARSTAAWIAWKTGRHPGAVNHTLRVADVCELLPESAAAWRAGEITTPAMEMIAAARVRGFDDELVASEAEFLEPARRRDHRSLRLVTQHFKRCAEADGRRPERVDGITLTTVGDRTVIRGELHADAAETFAHVISVFSVPPVEGDGITSSQRRAHALVHACGMALGRGVDAATARPAVT